MRWNLVIFLQSVMAAISGMRCDFRKSYTLFLAHFYSSVPVSFLAFHRCALWTIVVNILHHLSSFSLEAVGWNFFLHNLKLFQISHFCSGKNSIQYTANFWMQPTICFVFICRGEIFSIRCDIVTNKICYSIFPLFIHLNDFIYECVAHRKGYPRWSELHF